MQIRCDTFGTLWATVAQTNFKRGDIIKIVKSHFLVKRVTSENCYVKAITESQYDTFKSGKVKQEIKDTLMNYPIEECEDYEEMVTELEMMFIEEFIG